MNYTHLHLHTEYSILDGANKIKELAKRLKELDFKSCAITDHGCMFGVIEFYKAMKSNGIKPIIGMESYLHEADDISDNNDQRWHICLFAKNQKGYENLMYLSSQAYIHGFYRKPRINKKMLKEHSEGLVCSSACLAGEVNWHLNANEVRRNGKTNADYGAKGYEGAKKSALWYKEVFGDDFYLEIMRMGIGSQLNIDNDILKLGRELGIKVIATNDAHYTYKDRAQAQNIFMAINTGALITEYYKKKGATGLIHEMSEIYVKSPQQMHELFLDVPEVVENTQEIVDKCNLELDLGNPTPPNFKFALEYAKKIDLSLPSDEIFSFENDDILFEKLCWIGLEKRLKHIDKSKHDEYKQRLIREMDIIKNMHFSGYMLIVHDFIKAAKDIKVPVGPGRGSAAGSLVAFSLEITDLDPLPYNLLFERFLNPERISMPDIDVDFCQARRGEVIDYVVEKYGRYNVAQVITFGKLLAKGVIRDVSRVCDISIKDADTLAKLIPDELNIKLKDAYEKNPDIEVFLDKLNKKEEYKDNIVHPEDTRQTNKIGSRIWEYALALEGLNRNPGMHAAGVVISNEELWKKTPLFKQTKSDALVTQYAKDYLEDVDLIKFDFLGLKTLTVIDNAISLIKKRHNIDIDWNTIDVNDKGVYDLIQTGNTLGIFQIESSGMQDLNSRLKPTCFEDLIAVLALYRPGPLDSGMVDDFIDIKHGRKPTVYAFPELKSILEPTYGVIVYQEQVMQIVQTVGGFSLGGADLVRRAMGKKKLEEMVKLKGEYLQGAKKGGFDEKKADDLWELILKFAEYGFNKSHSAAYALITFQTAYLKCYYEAEFMAALLTSEEGNATKIERYKDELNRLNIKLLPPDINDGAREFNVIKKDGKTAIVYGFGSIKGLGIPSAQEVVRARGDKPFNDINDFISRTDGALMNKKTLEALALTGCFESLGISRKNLFDAIEFISAEFKRKKEHEKRLEESLFAQFDSKYESKLVLGNDIEYSDSELAAFDKEYLGIYIGTHPLDAHKELINKISHYDTSKIESLDDGDYEMFCIGAIEEVDFKQSKGGKYYANIKFIDYYTNFNILSFNEAANKLLELDYKQMNAGDKKSIDSSEDNKLSKAKDSSESIKLFALSLSLKRDNAHNTFFLNKLIPLNNEIDLIVSEDGKNELGFNVFSIKGQSNSLDEFEELIKRIQHYDLANISELEAGEYDIFGLFGIKKIDYRISKKGNQYANIKAYDKNKIDYSFFCFNDDLIKKFQKIHEENEERALYGLEINLRIFENDPPTFYISDCIKITPDAIKEPKDGLNELGFTSFSRREITKKNRKFSKKDDDFIKQPKDFEGEYISIDILNIEDEIISEVLRLIKEHKSPSEIQEAIVLEFFSNSCVLKYSKPINLAKEKIEQIKQMLKIS